MARARLATLYPTALVTGAGAGLGRAFCDMLLAEGVHVWGTARTASRLAELAKQPRFTPVLLDLADRLGVQTVFAQAAKQTAQVDAGLAPAEATPKATHPMDGVNAVDAAAPWPEAAEPSAQAAPTRPHTQQSPASTPHGFALVINNAGYGIFADALATQEELWERQWEEMVLTTLRLGRLALCGMMARGGGCLVNVSSLAVEFPLPYLSGYNVAKAALAAWSESLLYELPGDSVRIIDLRPGDFRTDFNRAAMQGPGSAQPAAARVWRRLEQNLLTAPAPARAAEDLRRALAARRIGVVRTGSWFQARLAPALANLVPEHWKRAAQRRFFDLR